jgi:nucleotide-binding universal stress UspA family protein
MHRVLVPVVGSEGALRAVAHVIGSVHSAPSEVHLLNVQPLIMTGDIGPNVTSEMVQLGRLAAGEAVLQPARALLDASRIPHTTTIRFGSPAEAIVQYVKDRGIDAIVMGTRGMNVLKTFLLGSVAAKVVGLTDVPVTLVKSDLRVSRTPTPRTSDRCGRRSEPFRVVSAARDNDALSRSRHGLRGRLRHLAGAFAEARSQPSLRRCSVPA